jgi:hypothetical protein
MDEQQVSPSPDRKNSVTLSNPYKSPKKRHSSNRRRASEVRKTDPGKVENSVENEISTRGDFLDDDDYNTKGRSTKIFGGTGALIGQQPKLRASF